MDDTLERMNEHIKEILRGFENDPPDTEYQKGYKAAIRDIQRVWFPGSTED